MKKNGAEIIIECLLEQGVSTVFGYPGGAVLNIYDALYKYRDKIRHVLTAHEQGASHAADGYARSTGKVGVCFATSGPGATNLVTGIATAYMDSVPIVAITGNVALPLLGRDSFQEIDITGITMPITKHNFLVESVEELADTIRLAFEIAQSGRPGPVLVDVPKDITAAIAEYLPKAAAQKREYIPPKTDRIDMTLKNLLNCKKPLIYVGGGVISSNAENELVTFAEKLDIPVCSSMMALGSFPGNSKLWLGMVGMHGTFAANKAVNNCDLLIVCGARFSDRVAGNTEQFAPNACIVHIDIDHAEFDKNVISSVRLGGNLKDVLNILIEKTSDTKHSDWVDLVNSYKKTVIINSQDENAPPDPLYILQTLRALTDEDVIIATDVGQHQMWTAQHFEMKKTRSFLTSGGLGTMGYGLGAAIGAQVAHPSKKVVLISGDGSFHMNLNELVTLASFNLPIVIVLMNNQVLGMVRQWQKVFYDNRFSETDPKRKTDFVALAKAFGCEGMRISKTSEVESTIKTALEMNRPVLIDCQISPDSNVLPMIPPGGTIDAIIEEM